MSVYVDISCPVFPSDSKVDRGSGRRVYVVLHDLMNALSLGAYTDAADSSIISTTHRDRYTLRVRFFGRRGLELSRADPAVLAAWARLEDACTAPPEVQEYLDAGLGFADHELITTGSNLPPLSLDGRHEVPIESLRDGRSIGLYSLQLQHSTRELLLSWRRSYDVILQLRFATGYQRWAESQLHEPGSRLHRIGRRVSQRLSRELSVSVRYANEPMSPNPSRALDGDAI